MKTQSRLSRNAERKLNYARLASEQDKESRNRELSTALGEGNANVEAKAEWITKTREEILQGPPGKKDKKRIVYEREMVAPKIISPNMPTSATRSAKRTRLKAARSRIVSNVSHPNGDCGNIGCRSCNPMQNKPKPRFAKL